MPHGRNRRLVAGRSLPKERHRLHSMTKTWRQSGGVRGFGIGEKIAGAQRTNDLAIRIYVEQKQPISALAHPVPSTLELPDFGTIPTDVVEIGRVVAQLDTRRYRPALPGCSIGHWNRRPGRSVAMSASAEPEPHLHPQQRPCPGHQRLRIWNARRPDRPAGSA